MPYLSPDLFAECDPDKFRAAVAELQQKWPPELMSEGRPDFLRVCLVIHEFVATVRLDLELGKVEHNLDLEPLWKLKETISVADIKRFRWARKFLERSGLLPKDRELRFLWYLIGIYLKVAECQLPKNLPPILATLLNMVEEASAVLIELADRIAKFEAVENRKARRAKGAAMRHDRAERQGVAAIKAKAVQLASAFNKRNRSASKKRIASYVCDQLFDEAYKAGVLTSRENAPDTIMCWLSKR